MCVGMGSVGGACRISMGLCPGWCPECQGFEKAVCFLMLSESLQSSSASGLEHSRNSKLYCQYWSFHFLSEYLNWLRHYAKSLANIYQNNMEEEV
jgi:hypothetical protein